MIYLLDTDILVYWMNGSHAIEDKALSAGLSNISISIISKAELYYGAYNSKYIENNLNNIHLLTEKITVLNFDDKSARSFGEIKSY